MIADAPEPPSGYLGVALGVLALAAFHWALWRDFRASVGAGSGEPEETGND